MPNTTQSYGRLSEWEVTKIIQFHTSSINWNWKNFYDAKWEADPAHSNPTFVRYVEETHATVRIVAQKDTQLFRDFQQAFIRNGGIYRRQRAPHDWLLKVLARFIAINGCTQFYKILIPELASGDPTE